MERKACNLLDVDLQTKRGGNSFCALLHRTVKLHFALQLVACHHPHFIILSCGGCIVIVRFLECCSRGRGKYHHVRFHLPQSKGGHISVFALLHFVHLFDSTFFLLADLVFQGETGHCGLLALCVSQLRERPSGADKLLVNRNSDRIDKAELNEYL